MMSRIKIIRGFKHCADGIHVVEIPPGEYVVVGERDVPDRGEISQLAGDTALQEGWAVPLAVRASESKDPGPQSLESGKDEPSSSSQVEKVPAKKTRKKRKAKPKS